VVGDLNVIRSRFDEICWPGNEGRSTNIVIIFVVFIALCLIVSA